MEGGGGGTSTLNAHIWNHLTSVLLTELNSFYRLEHILLCSGQEGGWPYFSDEEQSRQKNLCCSDLYTLSFEPERKCFQSSLNPKLTKNIRWKQLNTFPVIQWHWCMGIDYDFAKRGFLNNSLTGLACTSSTLFSVLYNKFFLNYYDQYYYYYVVGVLSLYKTTWNFRLKKGGTIL